MAFSLLDIETFGLLEKKIICSYLVKKNKYEFDPSIGYYRERLSTEILMWLESIRRWNHENRLNLYARQTRSQDDKEKVIFSLQRTRNWNLLQSMQQRYEPLTISHKTPHFERGWAAFKRSKRRNQRVKKGNNKIINSILSFFHHLLWWIVQRWIHKELKISPTFWDEFSFLLRSTNNNIQYYTMQDLSIQYVNVHVPK